MPNCPPSQVAGNIGDVLEAVNPSIKNTLVKCMRQPATTLSVQLAAIQAFRRMSVTDEVNNNPFRYNFTVFAVLTLYSGSSCAGS